MDLIVAILSKHGLEIMALVLVMAGVYEIFHKSNAQTASGWESEMVTNVDGFFQGGLTARNFSGLNNSVAIKANLVPKGMLNGDGSTIKGPWANSYVTLSSTSNGMGFTASWVEVPSDDCATFARSQSANMISINSTSIDPTNSAAASSIAMACNAGASSSTATITFEHDS
ncbi:type 4 pilus major pilin [Acetobacter sp. LMG 32666]|uniref:type 4 pilus major pilin n=1 Tax=Acetobacter sp. LMG 32666 TaxID=2959295 RepID=UPI0030C8CD5A